MSPTNSNAVALEDFIQAVQSQLDTAQTRMTLRAQNDRLPLTCAIRDISMDLKAHVELQQGEVRIRPAGPADADPTVLHLVFAAITRLPADKLESVLSRATRPMVRDVDAEPLPPLSGGDELRQRLRVRGRNLLRDGAPARVSIDGRPVSVVQASDTELVLEPAPDQLAGAMSLMHDASTRTELWFDRSGSGRGA